ncbi:MAG: NUDIX hydrolase [Candidatus Brocadia sp.]|nr:NUDIX hydrolase [Candidatus Brocadia sp.]
MIIYNGKKINVRREEVLLDEGRKVTREVIEHPGSAAIIPFVTQDEIILLQQYRYPMKETLYEIPAGTLDRGESFSTCAGRELEEEIGYRAGTLELLIILYPSPGILNETMHLFKATNLVKTQTNYQVDEAIKGTIQVKLNDALEMIRKGIIKDAKTVCSILWCLR